jgi:O-antigen/teichoic acid export membrane protein
MVFNLFFEPKPELLLYLKWILPSIPFWSVLILSSGVMRARKMNRSYAFYVMSSRFVVLTMFVFLFSITEIQLILKCYFFSIFFFSIISVIHVFLILKRISFTTQNNTWIFLKQSIPMMLSSSILVFMSWMDTFIMGIFEEESEVGIYNVAVKITTLSVFSLQAINSILAPKIAQAHANNERVVYLNLISFSTKINFYITIVAVSLVMIFHNFLLGLFGEGFEAGFYVLLILCIGQLINSLSGSVGTIMQMIGEQNKYQTFIVIAFIINLGLTVVLTPLFGGTGAATATVISMVFWNITGAVYLKKRENIISYYTFGNRKTH